MAKGGRILAQAGSAGIAIGVTGATATAASAATIIVASAGAAAIVLVGFGIYSWLCSSDDERPTRSEP